MDHRQVVANVHAYAADAAAAVQAGKPYVFGETNSHSSGGVAGLSSSFGAALWTLDYALRAAAHNVSRAYFHQTTLGRCSYCFWDRDAVQAPYYGATAAVAVLAGAAHIGPLDNGTTAYAAYATWDRDGKPLRALLYNSDYYDTRFGFVKRSPLVTLAGLGKRSVVRAKRLTAQDALAQAVDETGRVSFGSQTFEAETCVARGKEVFETVDVVDGQADFFLRPSEALVVYLQ